MSGDPPIWVLSNPCCDLASEIRRDGHIVVAFIRLCLPDSILFFLALLQRSVNSKLCSPLLNPSIPQPTGIPEVHHALVYNDLRNPGLEARLAAKGGEIPEGRNVSRLDGARAIGLCQFHGSSSRATEEKVTYPLAPSRLGRRHWNGCAHDALS